MLNFFPGRMTHCLPNIIQRRVFFSAMPLQVNTCCYVIKHSISAHTGFLMGKIAHFKICGQIHQHASQLCAAPVTQNNLKPARTDWFNQLVVLSLEQCKPAEAYQQICLLSSYFEGFISQPNLTSKVSLHVKVISYFLSNSSEVKVHYDASKVSVATMSKRKFCVMWVKTGLLDQDWVYPECVGSSNGAQHGMLGTEGKQKDCFWNPVQLSLPYRTHKMPQRAKYSVAHGEQI